MTDKLATYTHAVRKGFVSTMQARWMEGLWPSDPNPFPRFRPFRFLPH